LVIGIPDDRLGQRVAAIIQPREGETVDRDDLEAVVRTQVAGYKVPRTVWFTDSIGRTPSGKADYVWARKFADAKLTQTRPGGSSPRAGPAGGSGGSSPRAGPAGGSGGSAPRASTAAETER